MAIYERVRKDVDPKIKNIFFKIFQNHVHPKSKVFTLETFLAAFTDLELLGEFSNEIRKLKEVDFTKDLIKDMRSNEFIQQLPEDLIMIIFNFGTTSKTELLLNTQNSEDHVGKFSK